MFSYNSDHVEYIEQLRKRRRKKMLITPHAEDFSSFFLHFFLLFLLFNRDAKFNLIFFVYNLHEEPYNFDANYIYI